ncbi:hypothetical protein [Thalassorhabdomicrobium marinisediminis]|uniref:hypothetical protein n=1 Tax=Thalassorhabdomicrobium marinisediminis TaxID=2170577 RepID=UPI002490D5F9|nr:hypothetical protein [Thalassorhabdomicrobium marinisediminis]
MAETSVTRRRIIGRITYLALALLILFVQLIPLDTVPPGLGGTSLLPITQPRALAGTETEVLFDPARWIGPDVLLLLTLAWVVRRPSFVSALAITAVYLLADMLLQRPPGLWSGLVLILTETLRRRARSLWTLPFMLEWATVAGGVIAISAVYRLVLSLTVVPHPPLGLTLLHLMITLALYPAAVFLSYALFGVSRPAPGEVDALGHRL